MVVDNYERIVYVNRKMYFFSNLKMYESQKKQIEIKKHEVELKERGIKSITKMIMVCKGKQFKMEIE